MRRLLCGLLLVCVFAAPHRARAQQTQPTTAKPDSTAGQAPDTTPRLISPRAAFLRSVIVPGWGQISAHAYNRAAVFITLQSASWYMLVGSSRCHTPSTGPGRTRPEGTQSKNWAFNT